MTYGEVEGFPEISEAEIRLYQVVDREGKLIHYNEPVTETDKRPIQDERN